MKSNKKILSLLLFFLSIFVLVSCGGNSTPAPKPENLRVDGTILRWDNPVDNVEIEYEVTYKFGTTTKQKIVIGQSFNFTEFKDNEKIEFEVKTLPFGEFGAESEAVKATYEKQETGPEQPKTITLKEANDYPDGATVTVKATVHEINGEWSEQYENMNITLKDSTGTLYVFRTSTKVKLGDIVILTGKMDTYNNERQIAQGSTAEIVDHDTSYDEQGHVHEYVDGKCSCGQADPNYGGSTSDQGYLTSVATGVPYIFKMEHTNLGTTLYITGEMDGYYYQTTTKLSESIIVYLEAASNGYYVYHLKNDQKIYLDIIPSGTHINVIYNSTPGDPWKFDTTVNTLTNPVNGTDYMLGTSSSKTYKTYSANKLEYASTTCIAHLYKADNLQDDVDKPVIPDTPVNPGDLTVGHEDYYKDVLGLSGDALKTALKELMMETHTTYISYGDARYLFDETDPAQENGKIIGFYSRKLFSSEWDQGATWNREHVWPKSLSGGLYKDTGNSYKGAGSDMHMLRPESASVNSSRGNKMFGTASGCFEPIDEVKGDVARILFYMSVHYDMDIEGLGVASSVEMLLEWNDLDPVDEAEIARNSVVQKHQGNYNPFIDCADFADLINW